MKQFSFALLLVLLTLTSFSQSITVTYPNGGESWAGCTSKTITWTASGTSGYYSIDYSIDGGTTWTAITSGYNTSTGSYAWTVPNITSSNVRIKVTDFNSSAVNDVSNNNFTIIGPLILTAPNSGENWEAATSKQITWASSGTSNYYTLQYSVDAGQSWTNIVSSTYNVSGQYSWTVPNSPSVFAQVRITDIYNACMTDKSDSLFIITPPTPTITVTNPNSSSTYFVGNTTNINWSSSYLTSSFVKIEYSVDNGATWSTIVSATNNTGTYSWTLPNTPTTTALVRISEVGGIAMDVSNTTFTIATPYFTLVSPNGGEFWKGCETRTVSWLKGGTSNSHKLELSIDSGSTWNAVSTNAGSTAYSWTVPNTPASAAYLRVSDNNNAAYNDATDNTFHILINNDIIINTPNGGESIEALTSKTISWVSAPTTSRYTVQYSVDNGVNWSTIVSATYATSATWSVPNTPSSSCRVRVLDYYNSCILDESDANFAIIPPVPSITITSPNSGNSYYTNNNYTIYWTGANLVSPFVGIQYSLDGGANWSVISNATLNDGAEAWTMPSTLTTQGLIRIFDVGYPATADTSNGFFNIISPFITLTSPNGGQNYTGCSTQLVTYQKGGTSSNIRLEHSSNNGSTWSTLTSNAGSSSYNWKIPNVNSTTNLLRVSDVNTSTTADTSDAVFTIIPNNDIIVLSPNGGESWEGGTTKNISWVAAPTSSRFNVSYSLDGGTTWTTITSSTYNTSQSFTLPITPSTNVLVKVSDYYDNCIYDQSDALFEITPPVPFISLTSPNGGQTYYPGLNFGISWTSGYLTSAFVGIEYSNDGGTTWTTIVSATNNNGYYAFTAPSTLGSNYKVRVYEYGNQSIADTSDTPFTIAPASISLTSPNGGESYVGCNTTSVQYSKVGISGSLGFQYSVDSGLTWIPVSNSLTGSSYTWTLPNITTTKALAKVFDLNQGVAADTSNAVFAINKNPNIIVISPNGGDSLEVGTTATISWVAAGSSTRFSVYYSVDNGASWNTITSATYALSTSWTVPNSPSNQALIKVVDYYNTCITDESDAAFTISPPTPYITVTYPNGGNTLYVNQASYISWTSGYLSSAFVGIEYTTNNGATWTTITSATNNNGTYSWTLPATISTNYKVRVYDVGNTSTLGISANTFSLNPPSISLIAPNGGEQIYGCTSTTISWQKAGTSSSVKLEYSTDNGQTWNTIISSVGSSSYNWAVPSLSSTQALIRVTDNGLSSLTDASNSTFTFVPNTDIIVLNPNGNEQWEAGTTKTINWVYSPSVSRFQVNYSLNGGATWSSVISSTYNSSATWTVPNNPTSNALVQVVDYYSTCRVDQSDAVFTITPPTPVINIIYPTTQTLYAGNNVNIQWTSAYLTSSFVGISYSSDSGSTWQTVVNATNNTGSYVWALPATLSNNYLFRVFDTGNNATADTSNTTFKVIAPFLSLTAPNGGQSYTGCNTSSITWVRGGTSAAAKLYYSVDSGATFNYMSNSSSTTFNWIIPNLTTSNALIRIEDALNSAIADTSDAVFSFTKNNDIVVNYPQGGEAFLPGSSVNLQWVSIPSIGRYTVQYSTDNKQTWNNIVNSVYTNSYNWLVPNSPSSSVFIRVYDYYSSCIVDESNAAFTILPPVPALTLTNFNSGTYYQGANYNITWTSAYVTSNFVKLEYSIDNGLNWTTITTASLAANAYAWTMPTVLSTQALIRISELNNPTLNDVSNSTFNIEPSIVVTSPNGTGVTENYRGCSVTSITWTAGGTSNYYKLEYSTNAGTSWTTIVSSYYSNSSNGTYTWTLPNTASANCLVRVSDANNATKTDISDNLFSITAPITITYPNLGGYLQSGTTSPITWTVDGASNFYNIQYSINNGSTWTNIAFNYNTSTYNYNWSVPSITANATLLRVIDNLDACKMDVTDYPVAISPTAPNINIVTPNGNDSLTACTTVPITWTATGVTGTYKIEFTADGGTTWTTIVNNLVSGTNSYNWAVPSVSSSNCVVRVSDVSNASKFDVSDYPFKIVSPNAPSITASGSVNLCAGQTVQLTSSALNNNVWSTGDTTQSITVASPGNYTVTLVQSACSLYSNTVNVVVNPIPTAPVITANGPTTFCLGSNVSLSSNKTSGNSWNPGGQVGQTISVSSPGTYTLTYTDPNGCSSTSSGIAVAVSAPPTISVTGPTTICTGDSTILTSSSSTSNIWLPNGQTTQTIKVGTAGNYSVQVTDGNGCTASSNQIAITQKQTASTIQITAVGSTNICQNESVQLVSSNPTGNIWSNGQTTNSISVSTAGNYSVSFTDTSGCTVTSAPLAVTQKTTPAAPSISASNSSFCVGDSVLLTATATTGIIWNNGSNNTSIYAKTGGSYSAQAIGANGCYSNTSSTAITMHPLPTAPVISAGSSTTLCPGQQVLLSSNYPNGNTWSNGATAAFVIADTTATYTVTYTNSNGCSATSAPLSVTKSNVIPPQIIASGITTFCPSGSVQLSSTYVGSNLWSTAQTGQSITVNQSGSYTVSAVDSASGCALTSTPIAVSVLDAPTITANGNLSFCFGDSVVLQSSAGAATIWSNGTTGNQIVVKNPGSFSASVADANGCLVSSAPIAVAVNSLPTAPVITSNGSTNICQGQSVTLRSPFSSGNLWSNGSSVDSIVVSTSGTFALTYTNSNGCSKTSVPVAVTVNPLPTAPIISAASSTVFCQGGSVQLSSNYSAGNLWSTGSSAASIITTNTGNYALTYTDINGCSATSNTISVTVNPAPTAPIIAASATAFCSGDSVQLSSNYSTGNTWSTGSNASNIWIKNGGTIGLSVTNSLGCSSATATTVITENLVPTAPVITANAATTFCAGDSVTLSSSYATGNIWSTGATTPSIVVANTGNYSVSYASAAGCSNTSSATSIVVNAAPSTPTIAAIGGLSACQGDSVTLISSSAQNNLWSTGATSQQIKISSAAVVGLTVTNAAGCSKSATPATVSIHPVPAQPTISNSGIPVFCAGNSVTLSSSAPNSVWSTGATTSAITVSSSGVFTVATTNSFGCTATSTPLSITVNPTPATPILTANGATTFCQGDSVVVSTTVANSTITWSNGNIGNSTALLTSGSYTATATNAAGCAATSAPIVVTTNPQPQQPTITLLGNASFCQGDSVILVSSATSGNAWSNGATTSSVVVKTGGSYAVTQTNGFGCAATSNQQTVTVLASPAQPSITAVGATTFCQGESVTLVSSSSNNNTWSNGATTNSIVVSASNNYTVSVSNTAGCTTESNPILVTVNAAPAIPTVTATGPLAFCSGESVTLQASSGAQTSWSTGATGAQLVVSQPGNYSATITNSAGCSATSTTNTVIVYALPSTPGIIQIGMDLSTVNASSFQWMLSNVPVPNATNQSFTPPADGSYSVEIVDGNGCSAVSNAYVYTSIGISEPLENGITMQLFPNPASDQVTILLEGNSANSAQIELLDNLGRVLQSIDASHKPSVNLKVNQLATGMYFVRFSTASEQRIEKLIVQ